MVMKNRLAVLVVANTRKPGAEIEGRPEELVTAQLHDIRRHAGGTSIDGKFTLHHRGN